MKAHTQEQQGGNKPPIGTVRLTPRVFECAAAVSKLSQRALEAARMVLVEGVPQAETARQLGIKHRNHVWLAVRSIKKLLTQGGTCIACGRLLLSPAAPARSKVSGK